MLAFFQLFLDHSAAGLIEREHVDLPDDVNFIWREVSQVWNALMGHRGAVVSLLRGKLGRGVRLRDFHAVGESRVVHENLLDANRLHRMSVERHDYWVSRLEGRRRVVRRHLEEVWLGFVAEGRRA